MKKIISLFTVFIGLMGSSLIEAASGGEIKINSGEALLRKINEVDQATLEGLTFIELYFLKNAVLSVNGYRFAKDRWWLGQFFYPEPEDLMGCEAFPPCTIHPTCKLGCKLFDLSQLSVPRVDHNNNYQLTPKMASAFAKIRQAGLKKIRQMAEAKALQSALSTELKSLDGFKREGPMSDQFFRFALGRYIYFEFEKRDQNEFEQSLLRDLLGDFSLLQLIEQVKKDHYEFDNAELLGLYLGNLDLLRSVILARAGRMMSEPLKTEISQLGVIAQKGAAGNLSDAAKKTLNSVEEAMKRLAQSKLGDLPESFKKNNLEIDNASLSYSVGM